MPDFTLETSFYTQGYATVAGVDEAGRGPWAGPVVAAAVILRPENLPTGANDSKKLTAPARENIYAWLLENAHVGVGEASVAEIDTHNILQASLMAMQRAVAALPVPAAYVLVDGNKMPPNITGKAIVQGDAKVLSIAAASIVAKVVRDGLMRTLHATYPAYNWQKNAGYGTPEHQKALAVQGITPHHRASFAPIRALLQRP